MYGSVLMHHIPMGRPINDSHETQSHVGNTIDTEKNMFKEDHSHCNTKFYSNFSNFNVLPL
jgi:hypothetical protein